MLYQKKTYRMTRLDWVAYRMPEILVGVTGALAIIVAYVASAASL